MATRNGNGPQHHTRAEWLKKFQLCGMKCYYCGDPLTADTATKEHKTPICRGGADTIDNIVPACLPCNQKKGWRTEKEFRASRPGICRNPQSIGAIYKPKPSPALEERLNEPGLLKRVASEREQVSWAWRNPA